MHEKAIDIRWRDLDPYGHVNQAVYLTYAEEVLDDWFRVKLKRGPETPLDYVAKKTTIEYVAELRVTDRQVIGSAQLVTVGTTSVTAKVTLRAPNGRVAAELEHVAVMIDGPGGGSRPLTENERAALAA